MSRKKRSRIKRLENLSKARSRRSIGIKTETEYGDVNLIQKQPSFGEGNDSTCISFINEAFNLPTEQEIINLNLVDFENDETQVDDELIEVRKDGTASRPCQFMDGKCSVCLMEADLNELGINDQANSSESDPNQNNEGVISKQLSAMYLVHHLLGVPLEECTRYVKRYGNPANWMTLCASCKLMVKKARTIRDQILKLQNDLDEIKRHLIERTLVKIEMENLVWDESGPSWITAAYEIRQFVSYANILDENNANEDETLEPDSGQCLVIPTVVETKSEAHGSAFLYFDESESEFDNAEEPNFEASTSPKSLHDLDWLSSKTAPSSSSKKFVKPQTDNGRWKERQRETTDIYCLNSKKATRSLITNSRRCKKTVNNECHICFKNYNTKSALRSHFRYKHKSYLCHLNKQVPKDHVCLPGQCLPYSNSPKKIRKKPIKSKIICKESTTVAGVTSDNNALKGEQHSTTAISEVEVPFVIAATTAEDLETIYKMKHEQLAEAEKVLAALEPEKAANLRKTIKRKINSKVQTQLSKLKSFPCKKCSETFTRSGDLLRHINRAHTEGIKCEICGKVVAHVRTLENHTIIAHHPKSISKCSGCNKIMGYSEVFKKHLKHDERCKEKAVKCTECSRMFPSTESLEVHIQIRHLAPPPPAFSCSTCGKTFNDKKNLSAHQSAHHSTDEHICEKCGKSFPLLHSMKEHLQTVHLNKEPEGQKFPCPVCNRIFTSRKHLTRHKKLHNDESPYLCTICGKKYKVSNQLTTHYWSHDPDRYEKYSLYKYKSRTKQKREMQKNKKDSSQKNSDSNSDLSVNPEEESNQQPQPKSSITATFPNNAESISSDSPSLPTPIPVGTVPLAPTESSKNVSVSLNDDGEDRGQENIDSGATDMLPFLSFPIIPMTNPALPSSMPTYPQYHDL